MSYAMPILYIAIQFDKIATTDPSQSQTQLYLYRRIYLLHPSIS